MVPPFIVSPLVITYAGVLTESGKIEMKKRKAEDHLAGRQWHRTHSMAAVQHPHSRYIGFLAV